MPFQFSQYQHEHPQLYGDLLSRIHSSTDLSSAHKYFYSLSQKEGSWFGKHPVNLVLQTTFLPHFKSSLHYEKNLSLDIHHKYLPLCHFPNNIDLASLKMVARQNNRLILAYVDDSSDSLKELSLVFSTPQLSLEWQNLLKEQKSQAMSAIKNSIEKQTAIQGLLSTVKELQEQLSDLKAQCEQLLESNLTLKVQNNQYRQLVHNLSNQILKHKSESTSFCSLQRQIEQWQLPPPSQWASHFQGREQLLTGIADRHEEQREGVELILRQLDSIKGHHKMSRMTLESQPGKGDTED